MTRFGMCKVLLEFGGLVEQLFTGEIQYGNRAKVHLCPNSSPCTYTYTGITGYSIMITGH